MIYDPYKDLEAVYREEIQGKLALLRAGRVYGFVMAGSGLLERSKKDALREQEAERKSEARLLGSLKDSRLTAKYQKQKSEEQGKDSTDWRMTQFNAAQSILSGEHPQKWQYEKKRKTNVSKRPRRKECTEREAVFHVYATTKKARKNVDGFPTENFDNFLAAYKVFKHRLESDRIKNADVTFLSL